MGAAGSKLEKALGDQFPEGERYFGLENFGNTCYCNSVLQALYFYVPFREQLLEYCANNKNASDAEENLLTCLAETYFSSSKSNPFEGRGDDMIQDALQTHKDLTNERESLKWGSGLQGGNKSHTTACSMNEAQHIEDNMPKINFHVEVESQNELEVLRIKEWSFYRILRSIFDMANDRIGRFYL